MRAVVLETRHLDALEHLEVLCFSVPWSRVAILEELCNPLGRYVGIEDDNGVLLAYGGMQIVLDEGYITNIAAVPTHRRLGLGDRVMHLLLSIAERENLRYISLEVRESNAAAQGLYRKHGFTAEGRRPAYYDHPTEDALIMNLHINPEKGTTL